MKFYPEGQNSELCVKFETVSQIKDYAMKNEILESKVILCDREHNLHVDLGAMPGIIPREEGAIGIDDGSIRDIALISKVNKNVCFKILGFRRDDWGVLCAVLSRKCVQQECKTQFLNSLNIGDVIDARVTHLEKFGAFIDVGAGVNALIPIDMLSVSRISHPNQRLSEGDDIKVVLRKREEEKLTFSLKELLGTWEQNASHFSTGETVTGIVRSVESYGIFVELAPNLAGLAEPCEGTREGMKVSVFIKSLIPQKMKIKLVIVEAFDEGVSTQKPEFYINDGHIDFWRYSPDSCEREIVTDFSKD